MENILIIPHMLNTELPGDPAIPLRGIYAGEMKTHVHTTTCTWMFIAALFTMAKGWKAPKYPSTDKWVMKVWYILTVEYYSVIKRNEVLICATTWLNIENIMESTKKPDTKTIQCSILRKFRIYKSIDTSRTKVVA